MTEQKKSPRLRTVDKVNPPYPLNQFPSEFAYNLGKEIVYLLATKGDAVLEGSDWESMFSSCIGATWKPSNVGLDDVVLDSCAWGAKTVKSPNPFNQTIVRLISGRNSPAYSYNESFVLGADPDLLGEQILSIWNERVSAIRKRYKHVRTVALIKSSDLSKVVVFEFETIRYEPDLFVWKWNKRNNLEGFDKLTGFHCFTWQPHGSQFTIIERVPSEVLAINIRIPNKLNKEAVLSGVGFDKSWVKIFKKNDRCV